MQLKLFNKFPGSLIIFLTSPTYAEESLEELFATRMDESWPRHCQPIGSVSDAYHVYGHTLPLCASTRRFNEKSLSTLMTCFCVTNIREQLFGLAKYHVVGYTINGYA